MSGPSPIRGLRLGFGGHVRCRGGGVGLIPIPGLLATGSPRTFLLRQVIKMLTPTTCLLFCCNRSSPPSDSGCKMLHGACLQTKALAPDLAEGSWKTEVVTVLQRGWCLCPVSGPGSLRLGCWSHGGSWESQVHCSLCSKGNSKEKRRLKVQSQQDQQAGPGTSAEDC